MTKPNPFESLLETRSRAELRDQIAALRGELNLMWAQKLIRHCATLEPASNRLRIGIVRTYTSELLDPWLTLAGELQGLSVDLYHAPYGFTLQEAAPQSGLVAHRPDLTLLLLEREAVHPALVTPLAQQTPDAQQTLADEVLDRVCSLIHRFREQPVGHLVVSFLPALMGPALGSFDAQSEQSEGRWWSALKGRLAACLRNQTHATTLLDLDESLARVGRDHYFDKRLWYSTRFPFSAPAAFDVAAAVIALGSVLKQPKAKVIALDADNTLWGGVIGEDGIDGIALGPEYPGNCYMAFQRRVLELQQRGFILALCSKNNATDVDRVLAEHPHQLIKDSHLAARRVNWTDKPENLRSLAKELNLGLDAFVFIDDSAHEIAAVRRLLPEVEAVQMPANPLLVPDALEQVARLQILSLTDEDRAKTALYAAERQRRTHLASFEQGASDLGDYLASLGMRMQVVYNGAAQVARLAQLTQKTNQFNLTTRRYGEQEMAAFIAAEDWLVAHFSLADTFGDSGVVGLALVRRTDPATAELDTFLMSCRVIGREAEHAFMDTLRRALARRGTLTLLADYMPTAKNGLVASFLPEAGFMRRGDGRYHCDLRGLVEARAANAAPIEVSEMDASGAGTPPTEA